MKGSIIIPYYKTPDLIRENLPSVIAATKNPRNNIIEVIVVDDGSEDEGAKIVKKEFPEVKLVRHTKNRGFSSAVNTGARTARGELIVLLNTDVKPTKSFLFPVLKHFINKNVFAVSLAEKGYSWAKGKFENGFIEHCPGKPTKSAHQTFWISGGSGVFRRSIWMKLGGMDEKLLSPYYWEDVDLCYRAKKRGYELVWEPRAIVEHKHEGTVKKLDQKKLNRVRERNQLLVVWKNITSRGLFRKHLIGLTKRVFRHPGYLRIVFMAVGKLKLARLARKKEIKESTVSDESIFASF